VSRSANRVAVARRLGAPIVSCVSCSVTKRENESFRMVRFAAIGRPAFVAEHVYGCSISCAMGYSSLFPQDSLSVFRKRERGPYSPPGDKEEHHWECIGSFNRETPGLWVWTDTGNARWIEENVATLRARGEIS